MLTIIYVLSAWTALSLLVFATAIRLAPAFGSDLKLFDAISVTGRDGSENHTLSAVASVGVVLVVCFVGVALFARMRSAAYLLDVVIAAGCCAAFAKQVAEAYAPRLPVVAVYAIAGASGFLSGASLLVSPSWLVYDVAGFIVTVYLMNSVSFERMRYLVIGLAAIACYDAISVFGTGAMVQAVSGSGLGQDVIPPSTFVLPKDVGEFAAPTNAVILSTFGFGDLIFSGFVVRAAARYELARWAMGGYAVGFSACFASVVIFGIMMPAMLFLVPALLGAFFFGAWRRGVALEW